MLDGTWAIFTINSIVADSTEIATDALHATFDGNFHKLWCDECMLYLYNIVQ